VPTIGHSRHVQWLVVLAFVLAGCGHKFDPSEAAHVTQHAPSIGASAPAVQLTTASNGAVTLSDLTREHSQTVVVFYRGFF
jgi:hypothetical protein